MKLSTRILYLFFVAFLVSFSLLISACGNPDGLQTSLPTPTPVFLTPSPTLTPTPNPTPLPTSTPTQTPIPNVEIGFSRDLYTTSEEDGEIRLPLSITPNQISDSIELTYNVHCEGSVTASDFVDGTSPCRENTALFTIASSSEPYYIVLKITDDNLTEGDEEFMVVLESVVASGGSATISDLGKVAKVRIVDSDRTILGFLDSFTAVTEDDGFLSATLYADAPSDEEISADYIVYCADTDLSYCTEGRAIFAPGADDTTIQVQLPNDDLIETDEMVTIRLVDVQGGRGKASIDAERSQLVVTVMDDDTGIVGFAADSLDVQIEEIGGTVQLYVELTKESSEVVGVSYTVDCSALNGGDFTVDPCDDGELEFAAGMTRTSIEFNIRNDREEEGAETLVVTLTGITSGHSLVSVSSDAGIARLTILESDIPSSGGGGGSTRRRPAPPSSPLPPPPSIPTAGMLTVNVSPLADGVVTSQPMGINCGGGGTNCQSTFAQGTQVTLTATPTPGQVFSRWSGACTGTDDQCTVTISGASVTVEALFTVSSSPIVPETGKISVNVSPLTGGVVTSLPAGINCGEGNIDCEQTFNQGIQVILTATPTPGQVFSRWSGACTGSDEQCTVTVNETQITVGALFVSQAELLSALYEATDGDGWDKNTGWLTASDINDWYGITTTEDGSVVEIDLYNNNLKGSIPMELGKLPNLRNLFMGDNRLTGQIPEELGDLTTLRVLSLYDNNLDGPVPLMLTELPNLVLLDLGSNQLTGELPAELGDLTRLVGLSVYNNNLIGRIPSELGRLTNLETLILGRNAGLSGRVPDALCGKPDLSLTLSDTGLYCPDNPMEYDALVTFYEAANGDEWNHREGWLTAPDVDDWYGVTTEGGTVIGLDLHANNLIGDIGTIPSQLTVLSNLKRLDLSSNMLTGDIPSEFEELSNLEELSLAGNRLTGEIPLELGNLLTLTVLTLSDNRLTGAVEGNLESLLNLEVLDLSDNIGLSGGLPAELCEVPDLSFSNTDLLCSSLVITVMLSADTYGIEVTSTPEGIRCGDGNGHCKFSYPAGTTVTLTAAVDSRYSFTGWSPADCATPDDCVLPLESANVVVEPKFFLETERDVLVALYDATNGGGWNRGDGWLTEPDIDDWFGVTTISGAVVSIDLSSNNLSGTILPELGDLINLRELRLHTNDLSDGIPPEIGRLTNLQVISLGDNQLTGQIPTVLKDLTNLKELWLYQNGLTGAIPSELENLTNLQILSLWDNELTGSIPSDLGGLVNIELLDLSVNQLTGHIPPELGDLTNLTGLWLHQNVLTGEVPPALVNLSNLETLSLSANVDLSGRLPDGLCVVPDLRLSNTGLYCGEQSMTDVNALIALYQATNGDEWNRANGWTTEADIDEWEGVTTANGRVVRVSLPRNNLNGVIPPQLEDLTNLERLDLSDNRLTGAIPAQLGGLNNLVRLWLDDNDLIGPLSSDLGNLGFLEILDLADNPGLTGSISPILCSAIILDISGTELDCTLPLGARIYNDNLLVLPIEEDVTTIPVEDAITGGLPNLDLLRAYARSIYSQFEDAFDHLIFFSNLNSRFAANQRPGYRGVYRVVMNDTQGTGGDIFSNSDFYGSEGKLRGVIHLPERLGPFSTFRTTIHEFMHTWANFAIPSTRMYHWGFSSANGVLGGFDIANLMDLGRNRYSAGPFRPQSATTLSYARPYSPVELYFAGLIPPEDVPDLWVGEDGRWVDFGVVFQANEVSTYTIDDIIEQHGERVPNWLNSPKSLRAMAVLLVDEDHPATNDQLQRLSESISTLSYAGDEESPEHNYYEATGGRALIIMDGLSQQFLDDVEPIPITVSPPPDLVVKIFTIAQDTLRAGQDFQLAAEVRNQGTGPSGWTTLRYYLSSDATISTDDTEVGIDSVKILAASETSPEEISVTTPLSSGTYYYGACLESVFAESETANNCSEAVQVNVITESEVLSRLYEATNGDGWINNEGWLTESDVNEWHGITAESGTIVEIDLQFNNLSGAIPPELGLLSNLEGLYLSENQLSGEIPPELGNLSNLTILRLHNNRLSGAIPLEFGQLSNLEVLNLRNNQLSEGIPSEFGQLLNLVELYLSNNQLTGGIPAELGRLSNLILLWVNNNQRLTGSIPSALCSPDLDLDTSNTGLEDCIILNSSGTGGGAAGSAEDRLPSRPTLTVTVNVSPLIGGVVTSEPMGINCGDGNTDCELFLARDETVTLVASASAGYEFTGWGGACMGTDVCTISAGVPTVAVEAVFNRFPPMSSDSPSDRDVVIYEPGDMDCIEEDTGCDLFLGLDIGVTLPSNPRFTKRPDEVLSR